MLADASQQSVEFKPIERMDGFDSNFILQEFMDTDSTSPKFQALLNKAYKAIYDCDFEAARRLLGVVREIAGPSNVAAIELEGSLIRGELLHEKNR